MESKFKNEKNKLTSVLLYVLSGVILLLVVLIFVLIEKNNPGTVKRIFGADSEPTAVTETSSPDESTPEPGSTPTPTPEVSPTATPETTKAPTPTPTNGGDAELVSSVSMLTAGDNLYHTGILNEAMSVAASEGNGNDFSFDYIFTGVKSFISSTDISVINQESIILPKRYLSNNLSKYLRSDGSFVAPAEMADTLVNTGFDVIIMANNHMLDMGAAGLQWSLDYMKTRNDLVTVGAYYDVADRANIRVIEKNGIKIAMLGYTYDTNVPEERAREEEGFRFLVPYINDEEMIAELKLASSVADFTVVFIHWGNELEETPSDEQRRVASLLAENGAGIIVGHHPHVLQPIEYVDDGKGGQVLCAYSLGTLVSNMSSEKNMLAGFFSFDINLFSDGSTSVSGAVFTPTVFYYDMEYKNSRLYFLSEITDELATSHGIGNYPKNSEVKNKMTRATLYAYLQKTVDSSFLPAEYR